MLCAEDENGSQYKELQLDLIALKAQEVCLLKLLKIRFWHTSGEFGNLSEVGKIFHDSVITLDKLNILSRLIN